MPLKCIHFRVLRENFTQKQKRDEVPVPGHWGAFQKLGLKSQPDGYQV